jgi:hypothetical protein
MDQVVLGSNCDLNPSTLFELHFVAVFVGERIFNTKFSILALAFD